MPFLEYLSVCVCYYSQVKGPPPSLVFNRLFSDIKEEPGHPTLVHPRYYTFTITVNTKMDIIRVEQCLSSIKYQKCGPFI